MIIMSNLRAFLTENKDVASKEVEVIVSNRFVTDKGKALTFKIKPYNSAQLSEYQQQSTSYGKKGISKFDSTKFNVLQIIDNCVDPDFKSAEWAKELGVHTPEQVIETVLLAGEVVTLAEKITKISGFDQDINEVVEQAKK